MYILYITGCCYQSRYIISPTSTFKSLYRFHSIGYGGLSLSIEGPSKAEIQCKDNADGSLNISYRPSEPGYYIINLKFADHHVEGSPFTAKIGGEGSNRQREKIQRQREAVPLTEVGSTCKLTFKMPGNS